VSRDLGRDIFLEVTHLALQIVTLKPAAIRYGFKVIQIFILQADLAVGSRSRCVFCSRQSRFKGCALPQLTLLKLTFPIQAAARKIKKILGILGVAMDFFLRVEGTPLGGAHTIKAVKDVFHFMHATDLTVLRSKHILFMQV
jgi:hypothetical protein